MILSQALPTGKGQSNTASENSYPHYSLERPEHQGSGIANPTLMQLAALGYGEGDRVWVRLLCAKVKTPPESWEAMGLAWRTKDGRLVKNSIDGYLTLHQNGASFTRVVKVRDTDGKPLKGADGKPQYKDGRTYHNGLRYLHQQNQKGFGVYLVVNQGGRNDSDIAGSSLLFYECDEVSKDEQGKRLRALEKELGVLARLVVETSKSLHCYFATDWLDTSAGNEDRNNPCQWSKYQQQLIQKQDSDSSIWNASRLMRLAGFNHQKWDAESEELISTPVELVQHEPESYTPLSKFEEVLPPWDALRWGKPEKSKKTHKQPAKSVGAVLAGSDDPFNMLNFYPYLEQGGERAEYYTCKCPSHNGDSFDSLHIHKGTGAFKCHAGCENANVFQSAKEKAIAGGYQPSRGRTPEQWEEYKAKKKIEWLEQRTELARQNWQKRRIFTPTELMEQRYVSADLDQVGYCNIKAWAGGELVQAQGEHCDIASRIDIHALKSGMGTGKTEELTRILAQLRDMGAIAIGSRNSLLIQSCERWGKFKKWGVKDKDFHHIHNDNAHELLLKKDSRIATCIDSLIHFKPEHFDGKIIILDEVISIIKHGLLSSTLKGKREQCLEIFEQAIKRAALVIAWDGNNADIAVNYLTQLRGSDARVVKMLNQFKGDRLNVELVQSLGDEGQPLLRDKSPVEKKLKESMFAAMHLPPGTARSQFVISDSQRQLETLDNHLSSCGYRILRIDSKTTASKDGKALLKNLNEHLKVNQYDAVLVSPTGESGIDINIKNYFVHGFGFFCGVIDTDTQMQFLRRARACLDWTVWCQEYTLLEEWEGTRSPFARRLQSQLLDYLQQDAIACLNEDLRKPLLEEFIKKLSEQLNDVHAQTALQFMAARNFERTHTRECLELALKEAGHQAKIVNVTKDKAVSDELKESREAVIDTEAASIFHAPYMAIVDALKVKASFTATEEQRCAADKAFLLAQLPGIEETSVWSKDLVKTLQNDRELLKRLRRYWMLRHMDAAKERSRQQWAEMLDNSNFFSLDIHSDFLKLQAINSLGVLKFIDSGEVLTADSQSVQAVHERCKRSKKLQMALGRSPGKLAPMDWLGRLMKAIGAEKQTSMSVRDENGERHRRYVYLPPESDAMNAVLLQCLEKNLEKYLFQESPESVDESGLEVDHLKPKKVSKQGGGDPSAKPRHMVLVDDLERCHNWQDYQAIESNYASDSKELKRKAWKWLWDNNQETYERIKGISDRLKNARSQPQASAPEGYQVSLMEVAA